MYYKKIYVQVQCQKTLKPVLARCTSIFEEKFVSKVKANVIHNALSSQNIFKQKSFLVFLHFVWIIEVQNATEPLLVLEIVLYVCFNVAKVSDIDNKSDLIFFFININMDCSVIPCKIIPVKFLVHHFAEIFSTTHPPLPRFGCFLEDAGAQTL